MGRQGAEEEIIIDGFYLFHLSLAFAGTIHPNAAAYINPAMAMYFEQVNATAGSTETKLGLTFMCSEQFMSA